MALNSSNINAGSTETEVGAGALPNLNTENKSNGNFSGGGINFDTSKLGINNPFATKESQQPTFSVDDAFNPKVSGNLDIDLPKTNNNNSSSNNTTYSNNSKEPTMTVDEVYGKSNNQPVVEKQGDYSASSNEKSSVETSTFGKQDDITVTPLSVTENKGIVNNSAIQSVEGLDFQQKDKASQDVLDSRKRRDEVEAEDKSNQMRDSIKSAVTETNGGVGDFQIGTGEAEKAFNKENAVKQSSLKQLKQELDKTNKTLKEAENAKAEADNKAEQAEQNYQEALYKKNQADSLSQSIVSRLVQLGDDPLTNFLGKTGIIDTASLRSNIANMAEAYGIKIGDISKVNISELKAIGEKVVSEVMTTFEQDLKTAKNELADAQKQQKDLEAKQNTFMSKSKELESKYNKAQKDYNTWKTEAWANVQAGNTPESQPTYQSGAETSYNNAMNAIKNSAGNTPESEPTYQSGAETSYNNAMNAIKNSADATPEQQAQAEEALTNLENSRKTLEDAAGKVRSGDPVDLVAYLEALEKYNKNLKEAQNIGNRWTQTDFNEKYVKAVAKANDFKVTLSDGTEMEYSDFATEEATKSLQYVKALHEKKAADLEEDGHPILAKIERWKAKMSQTWLGSKLTFVDDKVRDQFNQMAKTNMRATYAAYNNVLKDTNATPEKKAEASAAINQAKALMTASVALQASTGFFSGIGGPMGDGEYGTTDPEALNAWQKTLNTVDNLIKITLGLGISPVANEAYQNMYYMAGAKVNESGLFTTDFDGDGFALCEEYGNNAAVGMIAGFCELAVGVAMAFNPATWQNSIKLIGDSIQTFLDGLYGVQKEVNKSQKYTQEVLFYLGEAKDIAESSGNEEAVQGITNAITQIENFELKADEVGNLDNWLEGSGSNTATNEKFNQALTYEEWLKLIEADPTMQKYAKKLIAEKKNAKESNADTRVNS